MDTSSQIIHSLITGLSQLDHILEKAEKWTMDTKTSPTALPSTRLIADMHPLSAQVQITCDNAKALAARLAGIDMPKFEDTETTLGELRARVTKTLEFIRTCTGKESMTDIEATFYWNPGKKLTGTDYVYTLGLPNFYFHLVTTYNILRANGVALGKGDFLGELNWKDV